MAPQKRQRSALFGKEELFRSDEENLHADFPISEGDSDDPVAIARRTHLFPSRTQ